MTGVVEPDHRQAALPNVAFKRVRNAPGPEWSAVREAEHQVVIAIVRAEQGLVLGLGCPVAGESSLSRAGERHPTAARPRLGPLEEPPNVLTGAVGARALGVS